MTPSDVEAGVATPPKPGARRIVLVDDHPMVRERLAELINHERDLQVCGEAADIPEALQVIRQQKPDLVILDLSLQTGFGLDLVREVSDHFPHVAMLVLTMYESPLYATRALRAGARGYLTKRDATSRVLQAIRTVLSGESYLSESIASRVAVEVVKRGVPEVKSPISLLSDRELQVLRMVARGVATRDMARELNVNLRTVETYRARIKEKLGLRNGSELLRFALDWAAREISP